MGELSKLVIAAAISVIISALIVVLSPISLEDPLGNIIAEKWCAERGCANIAIINRNNILAEEIIALSAFLFIVTNMIISPEYRYYSAILGLVLVVFSGVVPPQIIIQNAEWRLILFLIGSMSLAHYLQNLGVFRYLSIKILQSSRGDPKLLAIYISALSWLLSMVVDEVTSIIYVVALIIDIYKLTKYDVRPLIVLSVLTTNIGSMALPVGNPIGMYMAFTANLTVRDFLRRGLPLSFITLIITVFLSLVVLHKYFRELGKVISQERIRIFTQTYYANLTRKELRDIWKGIGILIAFLVTIVMNDSLAEVLSAITSMEISPHALLAFIPYIYLIIVATGKLGGDLKTVLEKGVEWPSLIFFISLFMLGYSLMWSGASHRIAYAITKLGLAMGGMGVLAQIYLILSATLSAFLDNLSVVVAFTSIGKTIVSTGGPTAIFWGILYGGVLGGNYTPIGSTANIVALSITEKYTKISWGDWVKIGGLLATVQIIVSLVWVSFL